MAKNDFEYEQKYDIGTEVISLVAKDIKEGYVFPDTEGEIKSFNNKTNTYSVAIKLINGESAEVEYREKDLILKKLDVVTSNETVVDARKTIKKLQRKCKLIIALFAVVIVLLVVAAIIATFVIKDGKMTAILLPLILAVIILLGVSCFLIIKPINEDIILNSRKIEAVALAEHKSAAKEKKNEISETYDELIIQIQRLKSLLDEKAITESEYNDAKKKLLKKL